MYITNAADHFLLNTVTVCHETASQASCYGIGQGPFLESHGNELLTKTLSLITVLQYCLYNNFSRKYKTFTSIIILQPQLKKNIGLEVITELVDTMIQVRSCSKVTMTTGGIC